MRHTYLIILIALLMGCAERNDPITPGIGDDNSFNLVSQTETLGWANNVWVEGNTAYIAADEVGVSIYDVASLAAPQIVASFPLGLPRDRALNVQLVNPDGHAMLLVVGRSSGLYFYDPVTYAYLGNFGSSIISGLFVLQVAVDSLHIGVTDYIDDGYGIRTMGYNSDFGFWATAQNFIAAQQGAYRGLYMDDDVTYLAHSQLGLDIFSIDYSVPDTAALLGNVGTPGSAYDVTLNRDKTHAIVADYQSGIQIIDVTDSSAPAIVSSLLPDRVDQVIKVEAVGDTVYFIDEHSAMYAADVSDPTNPILLGSYETPEPTGFFIRNDHTIFLTDEDLGLLILRWE